jgi:hypothetical protein
MRFFSPKKGFAFISAYHTLVFIGESLFLSGNKKTVDFKGITSYNYQKGCDAVFRK